MTAATPSAMPTGNRPRAKRVGRGAQTQKDVAS